MRIKDRAPFESRERQLLDFAHSYLSEAFPNPDHEGCPSNDALRSLAFNPNQTDPNITEHLAACSPCFRHYTELLAELKSQRAAEQRLSWRFIPAWSKAHPLLAGAALVCALLIAIGATVLLSRIGVPNPPQDAHRAPSPVQPVNPEVAFSPFSLDLSALSPARGPEPSTTASHVPVRVPSSPLCLTLILPLASEERSYNLSLTADGRTFWSKSAQAHLHKGQTLIQVEADFGHVPPGSYNFEVESSNSTHLVQPIAIVPASPNGTEKKR